MASEKLCPAGFPVVVLHTVQVLDSVQVAFFQLCPFALPSVSPHTQVLGSVQVASEKL